MRLFSVLFVFVLCAVFANQVNAQQCINGTCPTPVKNTVGFAVDTTQTVLQKAETAVGCAVCKTSNTAHNVVAGVKCHAKSAYCGVKCRVQKVFRSRCR